MVASSRASLSGKVTKAFTHPSRVLPHARRVFRNQRLKATSASHTEFYRAVMRQMAKNPDAAIGSVDRESWFEVGKIQHDYLLKHGLSAESRVLDIGCGNMRAGWRIAQTVDPGNYYGVDISPEIIVAAQDTIVELKLQDRLPHVTVVDDLSLAFLPDAHFDIVHAHSVFSHTHQDVIERAFDSVPRLLRPGAFFDFTYFESEDKPRAIADEDFYYPTQLLIDLAGKRGLNARRMGDWGPYVQAKMRVTLS